MPRECSVLLVVPEVSALSVFAVFKSVFTVFSIFLEFSVFIVLFIIVYCSLSKTVEQFGSVTVIKGDLGVSAPKG